MNVNGYDVSDSRDKNTVKSVLNDIRSDYINVDYQLRLKFDSKAGQQYLLFYQP